MSLPPEADNWWLSIWDPKAMLTEIGAVQDRFPRYFGSKADIDPMWRVAAFVPGRRFASAGPRSEKRRPIVQLDRSRLAGLLLLRVLWVRAVGMRQCQLSPFLQW